MILIPKISRRYKVFDCVGHEVPCVVKYDTDTKEIEVALRNRDGHFVVEGLGLSYEGNNVKTISFVLEGSYALDENGIKIC